MATAKDSDHAIANAAGWYGTICEHVAALECDRDRLQELRDERDDWDTADDDDRSDGPQRGDWAEENPEDAAELAELVAAVTIDGEELDEEQVHDRIQEAPLSVLVRSGWYSPGCEAEPPMDFEILLSTGGPALRIRGELDDHAEPSRAWLEHQDWGTPWTQYFDADADTLLRWCREFYFGG